MSIALLCLIAIALLIILNYPPLRRILITKWLIPAFSKHVPKISATEQAALNAGDVWWEGDLFRGNPDWKKWLSYTPPALSMEEQAFLEGPTETFCRMIDDWDITHVDLDLQPQAWQFLKEQGFFGLIIPKEYGGKAFSALAHSEILAKVCARSIVAATTIGVPNSLGPAELLIHYGTEEQKKYYLPRLARGEEIPCFALTSPDAGSDAASITDSGVICKHVFNGQEKLAIKLHFNKRYITLAPVATLVGLAFKLYDPHHLLGNQVDIGITCALIPVTTPGIEIGRRHFPANNPFQNGPLKGDNVFIPLDMIIGGADYAGKGWIMLMECLAVGRGITLPSNCSGGSRVAACAASAYARIRRQFHVPISSFEGIEKVLARMTGRAYAAESMRVFTAGAVDQGVAPAVASAITKYHVTEIGRLSGIDFMDVLGGKGICLGPRNFAGRGYQGAPIAITVEGANILTRNLIIFGQGALRCHPYLLKEVDALHETDPQKQLIDFDKVLFSHLFYALCNFGKTFWLGLTQGLSQLFAPHSIRAYYQQLSRYSTVLAFVSDITLALLGGNIKRKENLSARLGDVLSFLYMGSTVLKRFHSQGEPEDDLPIVHWAMQDILFQLYNALDQFLNNLHPRPIAWLLRFIIFPFGNHAKPPSDALEARVVKSMMQPNDVRARLYGNAYIAADPNNKIGQLEVAFSQVDQADFLLKKIKNASLEKHYPPLSFEQQLEEALALQIINREEMSYLQHYERLREEIIAVDDFTNEVLLNKIAN